MRYAVVEISKLHPHEQTRPALLEELVEQIGREGVLRRPLLVEDRHFVILDGHHRWEALKVLHCQRVPVYLVDYEDAGITVETWPQAIVAVVAKEEVVDHGVRGELFPPKTTRHVLSSSLEDLPVPLDELR